MMNVQECVVGGDRGPVKSIAMSRSGNYFSRSKFGFMKRMEKEFGNAQISNYWFSNAFNGIQSLSGTQMRREALLPVTHSFVIQTDHSKRVSSFERAEAGASDVKSGGGQVSPKKKRTYKKRGPYKKRGKYKTRGKYKKRKSKPKSENAPTKINALGAQHSKDCKKGRGCWKVETMGSGSPENVSKSNS